MPTERKCQYINIVIFLNATSAHNPILVMKWTEDFIVLDFTRPLLQLPTYHLIPDPSFPTIQVPARKHMV